MSLPADAGELERLLRARAPGPPPPKHSDPWEFLLDESDEVLRARVWPLVRRLLVDDDARIRSRALAFVAAWRGGRALTFDALLELATKHTDLFAAQAPEGVPLGDELSHALANQARGAASPSVVAALRGLVRDRLPVQNTATVFGSFAPDVISSLAARFSTDGRLPGYLEAAVGAAALYQRDELLSLLSSLRARPRAERERLLQVCEKELAIDEDKLRKIVALDGLPQPTRARPSSEELRAALALD